MTKRKSQKRKPLISALEPRVLFDGAALTTAVDVLDNTSFSNDTSNNTNDANDKNSIEDVPATQALERDRKEVAFVDTTVEDYQTLVDGINEGIEVVLIDSLEDISTELQNKTDIDAIHILSHGSTGSITIGNDVLNSTSLSTYDIVLQDIKNSLSQDGDILLYGCNVASSGEGQEFIDSLASLTSADVAASDDITGNSALSGDWDLEYEKGEIETDEISVDSFDGKLGTTSYTNDFSNVTGLSLDVARISTDNTNIVLNNLDTDSVGAFLDNNSSFDTDNYTVINYEFISQGGTGGNGHMIFFTDATNTTVTKGSADDFGYPSITKLAVSFSDRSNYAYLLDNTGAQSKDAIASKDIGSDIDGGSWRGVQVIIDGINDTMTVKYDSGNDGTYETTLFNEVDISSYTLPNNLKIGFSGSIGTETNTHRIDSLSVSTTTPNVAPTMSSVPSEVIVLEDAESNVDLSAIDVTDVDGDTLTMTITASGGVFSTPVDGSTIGSGVTETLVNNTTITLEGSAADINTYLDTASNIKYTSPNVTLGNTSDETLTIKVNDGSVDSSNYTVTINVTQNSNINEAPVIYTNNTFTINEGETAVGTVRATDDRNTDEAIFISDTNKDRETIESVIEITDMPYITDMTWTQELWIKPINTTSTTVEEYRGIIGGGDPGSITQRVMGLWQKGEKLHLSVGDGNVNDGFLTGDVLDIGQWNHVAVTADGSNYKLYVNGEEVFSQAIQISSMYQSNDFYIGALDNQFNGSINDVRIWDGTRTQTQIQDNMNAELNGDETDLIAYYKLNESSGTSTVNNSVKDENGDVVSYGTGTAKNISQTTQSGYTMQYSISGGTDAAKFQIDESTGALSFINASDSDYETQSSFAVEVKALDKQSGLESTQSITVNLNDLADDPTIIDDTVTLDEGETKEGNVLDNDYDSDMVTADGIELNTGSSDDQYLRLGDYQNPTDLLNDLETVDVSITFKSALTSGYNDPTLLSYQTSTESNNFIIQAIENPDKVLVFIEGSQYDTNILASNIMDGNEHTLNFTFDNSTKAYTLTLDSVSKSITGPITGSIANDGILLFGQESDAFAKDLSLDTNQKFSGTIKNITISTTDTNSGSNSVNFDLTDTTDSKDGTFSSGGYDLKAIYDNSGDPKEYLTVSAIRTGTVSGGSTGETSGTLGSTLTGDYGKLTINEDGSYSYEETANLTFGQKVTDSFTYTVINEDGSTFEGQLDFDITGTAVAINEAPVFSSSTSFTIPEHTTSVGTVVASDTSVNSAVDFAGSDDDATATGVTISNKSITMEGWFSFNDLTNQQNLLRFQDDNSNVRFVPYKTSSDEISFYISDGTNATSYDTGVIVQADEFYHLAFVYDGVNSKASVYVNGQATNVNNVSTYNINLSDDTNYIRIGAENGSGLNANVKVNDVRFWNEARTLSDIQTYMNYELNGNETNLLAYYKMDETSGTTLSDSTSNGYDLTISGTGTILDASMQTQNDLAQTFDGTDDYVDLETIGTDTLNGAFTLEARVNLDAYGSWARLFDLGNGQGDNNILFSQDGTSGKAILQVYNGSSSAYEVVTNSQIPLNEWVTISAVYDGASSVKIYFDGIEQATTIRSGAVVAANDVSRTSNFIGKSNWSADAYLDAQVSDARIWSVARTESQIKQYFDGDLEGNEAGLLRYYNFNETSGTTIKDSSTSINSADATLYGTTASLNLVESNKMTYSIVGGTDASLFEIDSSTGALSFKDAGAADFETKSAYDVQVRALDNTSKLYTDESITVNLTDDGLTDTDSDGVEDIRDIDDDGDGILDIYESTDDFKWATYSSFSGSQAKGDIGGTGFTYDLTRTSGTALNIQTTNGMYNHSQFPTDYNVPNSTSIKNTVASINTLTFDETILNPMLAFSSVGNGSTKVPIQFYDDVEILWARSLNGTGVIDGDGDGDGDYTYDSSTKTLTLGEEGYVIVKLKGEFDSIKFKYTADENYVNFTFGADIRKDIDTDGDGTVDRLDTDSDSDGVLDNVEAQVAGGYGLGANPSLSRYTAPSGNDSDYDGLDDAYDSDTASTQATASAGIDAIDSNSNGTLDYLVDEPPVLTVGTLNTFNVIDGSEIVVAPDLTLEDVENQDLDGVKVQINNLKAGDTLAFTNTAKIEGSYDSTTGVLTLSTISGQTASSADYQAALRTVTFDTTSTDEEARLYDFTIGTAIPFSGNGHYYEAVYVSGGITWTAAKTAAENSTLYGMQGYLATITSAEENAFILSKLPADGWIGGSDKDSEGNWVWTSGPEAGQALTYTNWSSGEPNNSGSNEDAIQFYASNGTGKWNDLPHTDRTLNYYIIEYGGMSGESTPVISASATMDVIGNQAPTVIASSNPNAIDFDGVDDYLTASDSLLNELTEFTISMWVNPDTIKATGNMSLVGQNNAFEIFLYKSGNDLMLKLWNRSEVSGGSTNDIQIDFNVTSYFTAGQWSHIALTGSDVSSDTVGDIKMYVNGTKVADGQTSSSIVNWGSSSDYTTIGGRVQNGSAGGDYFDAKFDEVSVWTRALSGDEVSTLQTARLDGNESDLLAYWTMDEGTGTVTENKVIGSNSNSNMVLTDGPTWVNSTLSVVTTYNENDNPAVIAPSVTLTDENNEIHTATVSISNGFVTGDTLTFTNDNSTMGNITASYDSSTGVMSLSSAGNSATIAQWEAALSSITYHTTNDVVNDGSRTVSWLVNDGFDDSVVDTSTINITGYGAAPRIFGTDTATVNEDGTVSLSGFSVADDDTSILTVKVTAKYGTLALGTTTGITGYTAGQQTIEITGSATDLTTALNSMSYTHDESLSDSDFNGVENLEIKASDDEGSTWSDYAISRTGLFYNSDNGHYYEYVAESGLSWEQAKVAAESRTYLGLGGYLATITSASENSLATANLGGQGWFGASDANKTWYKADGTSFTTSEGYWTWVTGPEAGTQFWMDDTNNNSSQGTESYQGTVVDGEYNNWKSGEPNDWGGEEDHAHFLTNGEWNDYRYNNSNIQGYVVEYGGLSTDVSSKPEAATLAITINSVNDAPVLGVTGTDSSPAAEYIENGDPITLASGVTLSDIDNTTLRSATVKVDPSDFTAGDVLSFTNDGSTMGNIEASYDASTGELTLVSPSDSDSLEFDGTGDYITSEVPYSTSFTLEAWINPDTLGADAGYSEIISFNEDSSTENVQLRLNSSGNLEFGMTDTGFDSTNSFLSSQTISTGQWTHVAVSYDAATTTATMYINGSKVGSKVVSEANINDITPERLMIGSFSYQPDTSGLFDYDGQMKEIRVWNDVRTLAEINANMNQGLDLTDSSNANLSAYFNASNVSNGVAKDISGNGYDGTLVGNTKVLQTGTGTATIAEWKSALESIKFNSTSYTPGATKDILWSVDDGQSANHASNVETTTIDIKELYSEQEVDFAVIDSSVNLSSFTGDFSGQYIDFKISDETTTESLGFATSNTADTTSGAVTIVGKAVYLGDGANAKVIGQIDDTLNGKDGNSLRINFAVDFVNGDFNSSNDSAGLLSSTRGNTVTIDGWKIVNDRVDFDTDTIAGLDIPDDTIMPSTTQGSDTNKDSSPITKHKGWEVSLNEDSTGDNSVQMYSKMVTADGYSIVRGPYIYSDSTVSLASGDSVSFQWKAEGGDDAYDVFGYIVNANDDSDYQVILNETGANASASTSWATETVTVDSDGEYKFVFVSGTWDATGGKWLGAQLYIDDVKVTQQTSSTAIDSTVLEKIAQKVTYTDTSDLTYKNALGDRTIEISAPKVASSLDTDKPVASFSSDSGTVTITFDEDLASGDELTVSDLSVANGSLSNFTRVSNTEYTVEVIKDAGYTGDLTLVLAASSVTDTDTTPLQNVEQSFVIKDNIDVTSDSGWEKVLYGNQYDYFDDVQSNKEGTDLVGDNDHTLLSTQYNSSTNELAFRVRLESDTPDGIFTLVGVDGTGDASIDFFVGVNIPSNGGTPTVEFYETGSGANDSPSTSSFKNPISATGGLVDISAASDGDDIDADGNIDGFVSFKFDADAFVNFANNQGGLSGYTINDEVSFMLLTATQTNSINGDIGGIDGNNSRVTYADMGAFKAITFGEDTSEENKATYTFDKQEVNDQILLSSVDAINYVDTDAKDTFSASSGTLSSSDVDAGTTAVYGIDGGTVNGTTITKEGAYGTLTLDSSTGAYTYTPNSTVMDALSSSSSEEFKFTVSDDNPNGLSTTDTTTLTINVTAVNDSPLLGGGDNSVTFTENGSSVLMDPSITIDDVEGGDYNGGYLLIKNTANAQTTDDLVINQINGVTVSGNNISYAGVVVGTIDSTFDGQDGNNLKINFNDKAYSSEVQAVARAIAFYNDSDAINSNARTYELQLNDGGNPTPKYSTKDLTVNVDAINDLPVISLDSTEYEVEKSLILNPDGTLALEGISLSDADHNSLTVVLETANYGVLNISDSVSGGLTTSDITNNGTNKVTITGSIEKINKTLANAYGLAYTADTTTDNGNDVVTPGLSYLKITATDADSGQDISTKQVTVLPAKPNALSDTIVANEGDEVDVNLETLIKDVNAGTRSITLGTGTASVDTNQDGDTLDSGESAGSIEPFSGNEIYDNGDSLTGKLIGYQLTNGTLTIAEGTLEDASPTFNFVYTPDDPNWSGTDKFVYQYTGDGETTLIAEINIVVNAVNDAPTVSLTSSETIVEDTTLTFNSTNSNAITLADADNTGSEVFELTLSVSNGKLDLDSTTGITFLEGTDNSSSMKLQGTLADLQSAINNLDYTPNAEYNGSDQLVIKFDDRGNIGQGNVLFDTKTVDITITPVDDAPEIDNASDIEYTYSNGANIVTPIENYVKVSDPDTAASSLEYKIDSDGVEDGSSTLVDTTSGTYGDLTIDPDTGKYTFTPDETVLATLDAGEYTQTFVLDVYDGTTHIQETITMKVTVEGTSTATYTEQDPATLILGDTNIQTNESYGGGYVEFEVSSPEATEILSLQKVNTADTTDGAISIVGNTIYKGDGTSASAIGQIDGTLNGQNGEKLRINFSVAFENGDFENSTNGATSVSGWTFGKEKVVLGTTQIAGWTTPDTDIYNTGRSSIPLGNYTRATFNQTANISTAYQTDDNTSNTTSIDLDGSDNAIYLDTGGASTAERYSVVRGPYVYSDSTVNLEVGDSVAFDWKALAGGDAYAPYGYLLNVNDGSTIELLDVWGTSSSSETAWATSKTTIGAGEAGEYRFVFIAGSYDRSGGRYVGGKLMIDNVEVIQANPPSGIGSDVLEKIAKKVTYENTGDLTEAQTVQNKTVTVTAHAGNGTEHSDTKALDIQEVNDNPTATTPATIYYTDTSAVDDFIVESGTINASDVDSGTVLAYEMTNATDNGTTFSKAGDYGTFEINKSTGAYSYTPNDSVINALGESTTESFTVTINDQDGGTIERTILIDITAVNDGPILGGPKPGDTSSDTYGAYTPISYTENSSAVQIDPTITVTDPESKSYEDGSLTISITSNMEIADQLTIKSIGGISVDGSNIKYGTAIIGTIDSNNDGSNGSDLRINLTSDAYSGEVEALMRAISFESTADKFDNTTRELEFNLNDGGNGGTTTPAFSTKDVQLNITPINDIPEVAFDNTSYEMEKVVGSTTVGSDENGTLYLTGISIDDVDETGDVTVVLSTTNSTAGYGLLTLKTDVTGGVSASDIQNNGTKSVTITGTVTEINATLAHANGLKYVAGNGNDSVTPGQNDLKITVTDSLNGSETSTKEVIVLPAVPNSYSINKILNEDGNTQFDLGDLTKDINDNGGYYIFGGTGTVGETTELLDGTIRVDSYGNLNKFTTSETLTEADGENGSDLNGDSDTTDGIGYDLGNGTVVLANDQVLGGDNANFIFTPNENWNGTEELYYQYVSGDGTISPVSKVLFYVNAVNDAPVITPDNSTPDVDEDTILEFNSLNSNRIVLSDVDVTSETLELTLDVSNGLLNLSETTGLTFLEGTSKDGHIKVRGSLSDLQTALDNMTYQGNQDYFGSDTLKVELNDLGNVGSQGNKLIDNKEIAITVNAVNDQPRLVNDKNLDNDKLAFGDIYTQDISDMFSDVEDSRLDMDFIAEGLPKGLTLDPRTGIISGKISDSGLFTVRVYAKDTGMPILSSPVKTFTLQVTAPPQPQAEPKAPSNDVNEVAQEVKEDIETNTASDIITQETTDEGTVVDLGNPLELTQITDRAAEVENTELTSLVRNNDGNPQDRIISAGVDLNVTNDGQVKFNDESAKSFETVGMKIDTINLSLDNLEFKVVDTRVGQKYTVTLADDSPLPETLKFDPNTGLITGQIPEDVELLEIKVSARADDGTTRILTIKLDAKAIKEAANNGDQVKFETLSDQVSAQNEKMNNYGDMVTSLFSA